MYENITVYGGNSLKKTINSDLVRGNIDTIVLKALYEGDRYGYDIVKEIEQKSSGQYVLKQPTLYSCLKRLEEKGFVRSYWGAKTAPGAAGKPNGGRRKYYTLTDLGRELFNASQTEWEYSRTVIDKLISDRAYDLVNFGDTPTTYPATASLKEMHHENSADIEEVSLEEYSHVTDSHNENNDDNDIALTTEELDTTAQASPTAIPQFTCPMFSRQDDAPTKDEENNEAESKSDNSDNTERLEALEEFYNEIISNDILDKPENSSDTIDEELNEKPHKYIDTSRIINDLLSSDSNDTSFSEKLAGEQYSATPKKQYPNFIPSPLFEQFEQFDDTDDEEEEEQNDLQNTVAATVAASRPSDNILPPTNTTTTLVSLREVKMEPPPPAPLPPSGFISYNTKPVYQDDETRLIIERDYKNVLTKLVENQTTAVPELPARQEVAPVMIPMSSEMEVNNRLLEERNAGLAEAPIQQVSTTISAPITETTTRHESFNELTVSMRELGDNISIRHHNALAVKEHNESLYYHSNRLMLVHYGIMFGIKLAMLITVFLMAHVVFSTPGPRLFPQFDILVYVFGVILAVTFPVLAVVLSFREPDKQKRIQYSFKNAFKYRLVLFINCLVLIYLINVYLGMHVSFDNAMDHLASLLLPALFALCLPISSVIFNALYKSGRYSVK